MTSRTGLSVSLPSWGALHVRAPAPAAVAPAPAITWRPRRGRLAGARDLLLAFAVWTAAWAFLVLGVLAPAGRL
ncbi:MAG TPA: hypothetical protein VH880_08245 [Anaeromyxobacteraceae bacterium]|jgi:hypothetical protein